MERKRKSKLDIKKLTKAIEGGAPLWMAAKIAGSDAKTKNALAVSAYSALQRSDANREEILGTLREKRDEVLEKMTPDKADKLGYDKLAKSFGLIQDHITRLEEKKNEGEGYLSWRIEGKRKLEDGRRIVDGNVIEPEPEPEPTLELESENE